MKKIIKKLNILTQIENIKTIKELADLLDCIHYEMDRRKINELKKNKGRQ